MAFSVVELICFFHIGTIRIVLCFMEYFFDGGLICGMFLDHGEKNFMWQYFQILTPFSY